jgi:two-component system LytT family sensor kinase
MRYFIEINRKDWTIVFVFGLVFGSILGGFISLILNIPVIKGMISGAIFGFFIFVFSFTLINLSNKKILPLLSDKYWTFVSLLMAFLAGFLGSLTAFEFIKMLKLIELEFSILFLLYLSVMVGLLTMLIGNLLYMIVNSKKIEEELNRLNIELKLKALEYQINPHFLFNALNTLSELIYIDPKLAEKGMLKLSQFLRMIIDENSIITLQDELKIVKNFIFIEKLRFPAIEFEFNIDKDTLSLQVPKMSIQLLVENAIKHGLRNNGKVIINSYIKDEYLYVEVKDSGKGFEDIKEGTGLKNLRERLKIFFNGELEYFYDGKFSTFRFFYKIP